MPAKAGIQTVPHVLGLWIPAFAGMTQIGAVGSVAQIFGPGADTVARTVLAGIAIAPFAFVAACYAIASSPHMTDEDITVTQPVPFSHEHHVGGLGIDCRFCHNGVESSPVAAVPPTETCMNCHSQIWTDAAMLEPVRHSLASGEPIHWRQVNRLPDYVYFDHSVHIAKGVGCTTCHGDVARMPLMRQAAPLTMGWCLDCHRNPAPKLRELADVFATDWAPPEDQDERGRRLMAKYHIHADTLTDCSLCHR
jgi:hypothetical protein